MIFVLFPTCGLANYRMNFHQYFIDLQQFQQSHLIKFIQCIYRNQTIFSTINYQTDRINFIIKTQPGLQISLQDNPQNRSQMEKEDPEIQRIDFDHPNNQLERTTNIFTQEFFSRSIFPILLTIINSTEIQKKIENVYQDIKKRNQLLCRITPFRKTLDQAECFFDAENSYFIIFIDLESATELVKRPDLMQKIKQIYVYVGQDPNAKLQFDKIKKQNDKKVIEMWRDVETFLKKAEREFMYCRGYGFNQYDSVVPGVALIQKSLFPDMIDLSEDKSDATRYRRILIALTKMFNSKELSRNKCKQLSKNEQREMDLQDILQKQKWLNQFYTFVERIYSQGSNQLKDLKQYKDMQSKLIEQIRNSNQTSQMKKERVSQRALQFYSRPTFYHGFLNMMLRFSKNISELKPISVPFNETYNGIKHFYHKYNQPSNLAENKIINQKKITLYRGTTLKNLYKLKVNDYVEIRGFFSTSKEQHIAKQFLNKLQQNQQKWMVNVQLPANLQYSSIDPGFFDYQWLNLEKRNLLSKNAAELKRQQQVLFNCFNVFQIKEIKLKNKSENLTQEQKQNNFNTIILEYGAIHKLQKSQPVSQNEESIISNIRLFRHEMNRIQDMGDVYFMLQLFDQCMHYRKNNRKNNNNLSDDVKDMQIQLARGKIDQSYQIAMSVVRKLEKQKTLQTLKNLKNKKLIKQILIQKEDYVYTKKMLTMQSIIYKEKSQDIQTNLKQIQVFYESAEIRFKEGFFSECQEYFKMGLESYQQKILPKIKQKQKQFNKRKEQLQKQKNQQKSIFSSFLSCFCSQDSINQQNQKLNKQLYLIKCQQRVFKNKYQTRCLDIQLKLNVGLLNCLNQMKSCDLVEKQEIIDHSLKSIKQYMDSKNNSNRESLENEQKAVQQKERIKRLTQPKNQDQQQGINHKYKQSTDQLPQQFQLRKSTYQLPQQFKLKRMFLLNQKNLIQQTKNIKKIETKFYQKIQNQQNNRRRQQQSLQIFLKLMSKTAPNTKKHAELQQAYAQWQIQALLNEQNNPNSILVKKVEKNQSQKRKVFDNEEYQKKIQSITRSYQNSITTRASLTSQEDSKVIYSRNKFAQFLFKSNRINKARQQAQTVLNIQKTKMHTSGAKAILTLCRIHLLKGQLSQADVKSLIALQILRDALIKDPKQAQYQCSFQMSEIYGEILLIKAKIYNKQQAHEQAKLLMSQSFKIAQTKINYKQNTKVAYNANIQEQMGYILVNQNIKNIQIIQIKFEKHFKKAIKLRKDQRGLFNIPNAICYCRMVSLQIKSLAKLKKYKKQLQKKQLTGQVRQSLIQLKTRIKQQRESTKALLEQADTIFSRFPVDHPDSWIIYSNKFTFDSSNRIKAQSNQLRNIQINKEIQTIQKCTQLIKNRYGLDSINYMDSKFKIYWILKEQQMKDVQREKIIQQLKQYLENDSQICRINNLKNLENNEKSQKYDLYKKVIKQNNQINQSINNE